MNILLIDDKNHLTLKWAKKIAEELKDNFNIILVSDRLKEMKQNNFEIFNINNKRQNLSIKDLQNKYNFSIYKLLVTDRSIVNYTDFSIIQMYSKYNENKINMELSKWLNAYDYLLRKKIDIVLTGLADNFKFNMAWKIAEFYNKKFYILYILYWWNNGILISDRYDQTSSIIDNNYYKFYNSVIDEKEKERLKNIFSNKKFNFNFVDNNIFTLKKRLLLVLNRRKSYESLSIRNWILRKFYFFYTNLIKKIYINSKYFNINNNINKEKFVIYPLHVAPEASILGSDPELADQFCLIKNISMNLPYGVKLYVKEHPSQVYGYNMNHNFYNKLLSIPNVKLIRANENVYNIIANKNCLAVAVLNGTLGLETAFKFKKPVFIFGKADYGVADCFIKPKNWEEFFNWMQKIQKNEWKFDEKAMWAILKAFDESVIKVEDVDFTKFEKWEDYAMEIRPILKFIKGLL
jgi:hypothetical protein